MTTRDGRSAAVQDARSALVAFGRRLVSEGLAIGTAGNLSVRVDDLIAITPSSLAYELLEPDDICVMSFDGRQVDGRAALSSEWPLHSSIYEATDAGAVVHTHSPEVVALSATCEALPAIHYAIVALGGPVPVVGYTRFGSRQLANNAVEVLSTHRAAILQNHGAVTYGATLAQAFERALLLEWLAHVYRLSLAYGTARILTTEELDDVAAEAARRRYGGLSEGQAPR